MIFTTILMIACVIIDQITKQLAVKGLYYIDTYPVIENVLHFTYVENRGAAFGMLADRRWIFMIISTVAIIAMLVLLYKEKPDNRWIQVSAAFIIGGGIGNMIDRVRLGYVVDFIDCRFIDFYVFNGADSFVCVGCVMFIIGVLWLERKSAKSKNGEENA